MADYVQSIYLPDYIGISILHSDNNQIYIPFHYFHMSCYDMNKSTFWGHRASLSVKMSSYQYSNSRYKDKTV